MPPQQQPQGAPTANSNQDEHIDRNIEFYTGIVRRRWIEAANQTIRQKKDEPILRVGEKLIWILTLFIVGLEREAQRLVADPEVTSSALRAVTNASRAAVREVRPRYNTEDDDSVSIASMTSMTSHTSIDKSPVFVPVLSEEQVLGLLPTLSELANSSKWRVRQSAVEIVPALLGCTSKFETRAEISRLCITNWRQNRCGHTSRCRMSLPKWWKFGKPWRRCQW